MTDKTNTTETLKQMSMLGLGCLTWLAIPAAILGIIGLFQVIF